jgi:hypothetical protein
LDQIAATVQARYADQLSFKLKPIGQRCASGGRSSVLASIKPPKKLLGLPAPTYPTCCLLCLRCCKYCKHGEPALMCK